MMRIAVLVGLFVLSPGGTLLRAQEHPDAQEERLRVLEVVLDTIAGRHGRIGPLLVSRETWALRLDPGRHLPAQLLLHPAPAVPAELLVEFSVRAAAPVRLDPSDRLASRVRLVEPDTLRRAPYQDAYAFWRIFQERLFPGVPGAILLTDVTFDPTRAQALAAYRLHCRCDTSEPPLSRLYLIVRDADGWRIGKEVPLDFGRGYPPPHPPFVVRTLPGEQDRRAVFALLLEHIIALHGSDGAPVVMNMFFWTRPSNSVADSGIQTQGLVDRLRDHAARNPASGITRVLLADFEARLWYGWQEFPSSLPERPDVHHVSPNSIRPGEHDDPIEFWRSFREERYPGAHGAIHVTAVALDAYQRRALLAYRLECGPGCSLTRVLLARHEDGDWRISETLELR